MKTKIIIVIAVILVIPLLLAIFLGGTWIYTQFRDRSIQKEVSEYVLANQNTWEQGELTDKKEIPYTFTGFMIGGVEYGYYYVYVCGQFRIGTDRTTAIRMHGW